MRYSAETKLSREQVLAKAERFFASGKDELKVVDKSESSVCMESGVGSVTVAVESPAKGKKNTVVIETDQYDLKVKDFIKAI